MRGQRRMKMNDETISKKINDACKIFISDDFIKTWNILLQAFWAVIIIREPVISN